MSFMDFLPHLMNPSQLLKSNNGRPFIQSLARNVAESSMGKAPTQYVNQHLLGDLPAADGTRPNDTLNSPQNLALQKMLQGWLQAK